MKLLINNPDNLQLDQFCNFICLEMQKYFQDTSNQNKQLINNINNNLYNIYNNKLINFNYILNLYFNKLKYKKDNKNNYIIYSDNNSKVPNTNIKIDTIACMINDGNLTINRYPIIENIFKKITYNIDLLYIYWENTYVN